MNMSRLEWKVGLFVLLSLVMAAALVMKFSKGTSVFTHAYELLLNTPNVGGIRPGASVLMAGVPIGKVDGVDLDESGTNVTMRLLIESRFQIHRDAQFTIEQAGFLGDQYVSIAPRANQRPVPLLQPGDSVRCEEPFNLQEVARSAAGLLRRVDQIVAKLNEAVARIDQTVLSEQTLTNLSSIVANFRTASERAHTTLQGIDALVQTNSPPLNTAISNLVQFSEQLDAVTAELQLVVATNRVEITSAVKNLETGTVHLKEILSDLQAGKGLAGGILKDEQLRLQFSATLSNLNVVSSNLNSHNLFWNLFSKRAPQPASSTGPAQTGKRVNP
jgi:phospholipid/cholesterol/gamma-HCH transport system substrate-binding protein